MFNYNRKGDKEKQAFPTGNKDEPRNHAIFNTNATVDTRKLEIKSECSNLIT